MSNATFAYPFDPTGTQASNKITAEHITIAPPELSEFHFIIPSATPFFRETMQVVHLPSQRTLVEGVDYACTHYFHDASMACAKPIYGSITFHDAQLAGAVRLTYQTLGGDWTLEATKIISILSNKLVNPRRVTWEQVADLPYAFPPIDHAWHLDDMVGMSEIVEVLEGIRDALAASGEGGLQTHIADKDNPHNTTKAQVGLELVENYPVATVAEAQAGTAVNRYLTVLRGAQLVEALIGNALNTHTNRSDNPHNTTKSQVGLGNVQDYPVASQIEAETGTANNRYMTALRTAQSIAVLAVAPITAHINRLDNPHSVTKAQVQLGNVQNFGVADAVAARAGTSNELYMTPAMTREAIASIALQGITDHFDNLNNPHQTNKTQVGLGNVQDYPVATREEAELGAASNRYLTVLRGAQLVNALTVGPLNEHLNTTGNPHGTTKADIQLGNVENYATATNEQAEAGTATNLYMTPAGTVALINALGGAGGGSSAALQAHLNDLANPHEVTKAQVGLGNVANNASATNAQAIEGTATNLFMTPASTRAQIMSLVGDSLTAHVNRIDNPHNVTATQTGAYTTAQTDALLEGKLNTSAKAADSALLDGMTLEDVVAAAQAVEYYPPVQNGFSQTWTLLGQTVLPVNLNTNQIPDIVAEVTGGENATFGVASTFTVRLAPRNLALSQVVIGTENYTREVSFGYTLTTVDNVRTLRLFLRGPISRRAVTVAPISQGSKFFVGGGEVVDVEPTDIVYMPLVMPAFTRTRPTFGDVAFGDLPQIANLDQITGGLVEWTSVVHTDEEELDARVIENSLQEDYNNFLPGSPGGYNYLYNDMSVLDQWCWNATEQGILLDAGEVAGTATLTANEYLTNYTFEVEIGSSDLKSNGAGVLAAVVQSAGRPFGIAVVRTPGGLTKVNEVSGHRYKLNTIALHIGTADVVDFDSEHGSLHWADTNLPDEDRDPDDFDPTNHGWSSAGKVRIRVVRAGNLLTIDVSQFGSTGYVPTEQVVLDFDTNSALAAFKDRPSTWGLISIQQPRVTFKVLNRPAQYRDYVRIGVSTDNGKQRHYRYDGAVWQMSYLGINNPLVRPNRLYFSDWNGVMYQSQKNGRLRPILIEAYSRENPTVLTP